MSNKEDTEVDPVYELQSALRALMNLTAAAYAHHVTQVPEHVQALRVLERMPSPLCTCIEDPSITCIMHPREPRKPTREERYLEALEEIAMHPREDDHHYAGFAFGRAWRALIDDDEALAEALRNSTYPAGWHRGHQLKR